MGAASRNELSDNSWEQRFCFGTFIVIEILVWQQLLLCDRILSNMYKSTRKENLDSLLTELCKLVNAKSETIVQQKTKIESSQVLKICNNGSDLLISTVEKHK